MLQKQTPKSKETIAIINCEELIKYMPITLDSNLYTGTLEDFDMNISLILDSEKAKDLISQFEKAKQIRNSKISNNLKKKPYVKIRVPFNELIV
jgi:small nuclear ribonucleoprotein (snRNP)-like protein